MTTVKLDSKKHKRDKFDCGVKELNNYLKLTANQQSSKDNSRTFVLEDKNDASKIVGFYTLSMVSVELTSLPKKLQKKHFSNNSAGLIARLGVDKEYASQGVGSWLLVDALLKLITASDTVGFGIILVDAKEGLNSFYEKFGFKAFENQTSKMYISVVDVRSSFK